MSRKFKLLFWTGLFIFANGTRAAIYRVRIEQNGIGFFFGSGKSGKVREIGGNSLILRLSLRFLSKYDFRVIFVDVKLMFLRSLFEIPGIEAIFLRFLGNTATNRYVVSLPVPHHVNNFLKAPLLIFI